MSTKLCVALGVAVASASCGNKPAAKPDAKAQAEAREEVEHVFYRLRRAQEDWHLPPHDSYLSISKNEKDVRPIVTAHDKPVPVDPLPSEWAQLTIDLREVPDDPSVHSDTGEPIDHLHCGYAMLAGTKVPGAGEAGPIVAALVAKRPPQRGGWYVLMARCPALDVALATISTMPDTLEFPLD